jgi:hypothetical protein
MSARPSVRRLADRPPALPRHFRDEYQAPHALMFVLLRLALIAAVAPKPRQK